MRVRAVSVDKARASRDHRGMTCAHGLSDDETVFSIDAQAMSFGPGAVHELGAHVVGMGLRKVALYTDKRVLALGPVDVAKASLVASGVHVEIFSDTEVEPTDVSVRAAVDFALRGKFDGYVSVGGGSSIDTCKLASLYATYPAELLAYVNAPLGEGRPIPGPLPPHVACPTTSGTGSECTGIAVFDFAEKNVKTAVASRRLRPTLALVDPSFTKTLPASVVAASGFDVLCHALESYTARRFTVRARSSSPSARPMSQGRNPWSDLGALEALRLAGKFFERGVRDASDAEAREGLSWAATLAGVAFGNAGVHLPHAMSYAVAGLAKSYRCPGYPEHHPLVPHGVSVVVSAPSVFRRTAPACPERHLAAAEALGADVRGATLDDAGEVLSTRLVELMTVSEVPLGWSHVGLAESSLPALVRGATIQKRLVDNAPLAVDEALMESLFRGARDYTVRA